MIKSPIFLYLVLLIGNILVHLREVHEFRESQMKGGGDFVERKYIRILAFAG